MGQVQSDVAAAVDEGEQFSPATLPDAQATPPPPSMESLIAGAGAEAASYGNNESESLDAKAQKALECPCIADLRNGQCGVQFSEAFFCYLKSTAEEKGSDCVHPFVTLQNCIKANPNAFSKGILEEGKVKEEEEPTHEYIRLPLWSRGSKSSKSNL
ncbi:mitochondrial intermembrane space import and assembly protein 40 homolog [Carya illinoinensis]|uniref:mitochondrial intermembrane space import and assembly protein 40 homolog n=1 Tax=Carya illinoinensis TaxID=32201 RepID=UPI001C725F8C|nr:mitochondrial intermembrane space import and assembly protein 40 homolog [Carya illinoinensis]